MSEWWINGKMTDMTMKEAISKLIDLQAHISRYCNPHDNWHTAVNIGIEAIERCIKEENKDGNDD